MSELTKEYFEEKLGGFEEKLTRLVSEEYLEERLAAQTTELKAFAEEQTEVLARIIQTSVVEPMEKRFENVETRLDSIDSKFGKLENALHINL
jgi:hypothetical protein